MKRSLTLRDDVTEKNQQIANELREFLNLLKDKQLHHEQKLAEILAEKYKNYKDAEELYDFLRGQHNMSRKDKLYILLQRSLTQRNLRDPETLGTEETDPESSPEKDSEKGVLLLPIQNTEKERITKKLYQPSHNSPRLYSPNTKKQLNRGTSLKDTRKSSSALEASPVQQSLGNNNNSKRFNSGEPGPALKMPPLALDPLQTSSAKPLLDGSLRKNISPHGPNSNQTRRTNLKKPLMSSVSPIRYQPSSYLTERTSDLPLDFSKEIAKKLSFAPLTHLQKQEVKVFISHLGDHSDQDLEFSSLSKAAKKFIVSLNSHNLSSINEITFASKHPQESPVPLSKPKRIPSRTPHITTKEEPFKLNSLSKAIKDEILSSPNLSSIDEITLASKYLKNPSELQNGPFSKDPHSKDLLYKDLFSKDPHSKDPAQISKKYHKAHSLGPTTEQQQEVQQFLCQLNDRSKPTPDIDLLSGPARNYILALYPPEAFNVPSHSFSPRTNNNIRFLYDLNIVKKYFPPKPNFLMNLELRLLKERRDEVSRKRHFISKIVLSNIAP